MCTCSIRLGRDIGNKYCISYLHLVRFRYMEVRYKESRLSVDLIPKESPVDYQRKYRYYERYRSVLAIKKL